MRNLMARLEERAVCSPRPLTLLQRLSSSYGSMNGSPHMLSPRSRKML